MSPQTVDGQQGNAPQEPISPAQPQPTAPPERHTHPQHPWCAATLDLVMRPLRRVRTKVIAQARGRVLEIGVGTGMNFVRYGDIESLDGIEPDPHMLARARKRTAGLPFPTRLQQIGAEALPFADDSFDTVVATWVLCTIPDPRAALVEMRRVLKPGGRLLFAEHVRSRFPRAARLQDLLAPAWKKLGGGCCLNRRSLELIAAAGFAQVSFKPCGRESWRLVPHYRGSAVKP